MREGVSSAWYPALNVRARQQQTTSSSDVLYTNPTPVMFVRNSAAVILDMAVAALFHRGSINNTLASILHCTDCRQVRRSISANISGNQLQQFPSCSWYNSVVNPNSRANAMLFMALHAVSVTVMSSPIQIICANWLPCILAQSSLRTPLACVGK